MDCVPRQLYMAWRPTSLNLPCPEHLELLLPRMFCFRRAAAQAFLPGLTQMLQLKFPFHRKLAGLDISSAKIWLKAVCIHGDLCASIPSLSRGVMSSSLILALEGADGAKILHLRARTTVWSQLHRFH